MHFGNLIQALDISLFQVAEDHGILLHDDRFSMLVTDDRSKVKQSPIMIEVEDLFERT